jgi:predicted enzyme related to lactoylglutathione lyase
MPHGDITHIDIPVDDMERATGFYGALFGWSISAPPGFEGYPMWQAPNAISGGGFGQRDEGFQYPRSYVEVDSIDDALARVVELGGTVVVPRSPINDTSSWAAFADTEGNRLGLYENTAPSA